MIKAAAHRRSNDQHYKTLLRVFLRELLEITHPTLAPQLRFDQCRFLDKETYTDLLVGRGYRMDLVCEIEMKDGQVRLLVIHVEIEERRRSPVKVPLGQRLSNYFMTLSLRHQKPVLPILVTFAPGAGGLLTDVFEVSVMEEVIYTLRYRRLGVRGLPAAKFLRGSNPLGHALAIRMKRGRLSKAELQLACERRIVHADLDESKQLLLLNSVRTYAELTPAQRREYEEKLNRKQNREVKEKTMTWLEKEVSQASKKVAKKVAKEATKKGEKKGILISIGDIWTERFGPMPEEVSMRLRKVPEPGLLRQVLGLVLKAQTEAEARTRIAALCPAS